MSWIRTAWSWSGTSRHWWWSRMLARALLGIGLAASGCASPRVLNGARAAALAAVACDAVQTASVAGRGWQNGAFESGNAGRMIGEHPSATSVGLYMAGYAVAMAGGIELLPRSWRAPAYGALAAWHTTAVVPNQAWAGGVCGIGG